MQIVRREGFQAGNEAGWPIGSYLYWKPEQWEDCHGPGGFARYDDTKSLTRADFFETREGAEKAIQWMAERFPGVICGVVSFKETK